MRTIIDITQLDTEQKLLSRSVLEEVFEETDLIERSRLLLSLQDKATMLHCKSKFDELVRAHKRVERELEKNKKSCINQNTSNFTEFAYGSTEYYCGSWVANDNGVRTYDMWGEHIACHHPILIVKRLQNAQTDKEKVVLAFYKGSKWKEITVDKGMIASSNKIVGLADYGVSVTSESAKLLVKYLSDLENYNINLIESKISTSKFGWFGKDFMPYDTDIEFDSESKFKDIYESLQPHGDFKTWLNLILQIRESGRYETQLYMAGAFASILLKPLNVLPFILNLWGETGKGKTVALMVATSIWANPAESKYITDPVSSQTALEVRENILNNLPMVIDDLSKTKDKYGDSFTDLIYMICGGKGKERSNINLGLNASTNWQNVCLTNIERPLASETMRGGAINRILDFEMEDGSIFKNGNKVVSIINQNYGFAGPIFVELIKEMPLEELRDMQEEYLRKINDTAKDKGVEKEEKQAIPLSVLLTADKLATDNIFKDGIYLDFERCVDTLKNKGDVNENERAYEFILSEISININKFEPDDDGNYRGECWGKIEDGTAIIISSAFDRICDKGNFSRKGFLRWAAKNNKIVCDNKGNPTKTSRFNGMSPRCIWVKVPEDMEDFTSTNNMDIPFD